MLEETQPVPVDAERMTFARALALATTRWLVAVDWNDNHSRASTQIGALLPDRVRTERESIVVEAMTLRVWVADIDSVAFNTDRDRDIVAIRGLPDEMKRVARSLAGLPESIGSVTVPDAAIDRTRIDTLGALNVPASGAAEVPALADTQPAALPPRFCARCGAAPLDAAAAYCSAYGKALT